MRMLIELAGDVDVERFVESWNSDDACLDIGMAAEMPAADRFDVPALVDAVLLVLEGVSLGVAGNAVYDLIVGKLNRPTTKRTYEQLTLPDGTRHIRVEEVDEN